MEGEGFYFGSILEYIEDRGPNNSKDAAKCTHKNDVVPGEPTNIMFFSLCVESV